MRGIIYCLNCGAPNVGNREYCSACQEDLRSPFRRNPASQRANNPYVETGLAGLFAGIVVAMVMIGLCVELFRWHRATGIGVAVVTFATGLASIGFSVRRASREARLEFRSGLAAGFGMTVAAALFAVACIIAFFILCLRALGLPGPL